MSRRRRAEQLSMLSSDGEEVTDPYYASVWQAMLRLFREVVAIVGTKQVAADLGVDDSVISHALAEDSRHFFKAKWIPYFVDKAPNDAIVELVAAIRGLIVSERRELTPEERLARLDAAMAKHVSREIRELITNEAFGPPRSRSK